jgi:hypothetical protein
MEAEGSSPCSQQPATGLYPEPGLRTSQASATSLRKKTNKMREELYKMGLIDAKNEIKYLCVNTEIQKPKAVRKSVLKWRKHEVVSRYAGSPPPPNW